MNMHKYYSCFKIKILPKEKPPYPNFIDHFSNLTAMDFFESVAQAHERLAEPGF